MLTWSYDASIQTLVVYNRNNITYCVIAPDGPGGVIDLTEQETETLLNAIDSCHTYGLISAQITTAQLLAQKSIWNNIKDRAVQEREAQATMVGPLPDEDSLSDDDSLSDNDVSRNSESSDEGSQDKRKMRAKQILSCRFS